MAPSDAPEQLCRPADFAAVPLTEGSEMILRRGGGRTAVVPGGLVEQLRAARTFRSLEEHAAVVTRQMGLDRAEEQRLLGVLRDLRDRGFFETLQEARSFAGAETPKTPIAAVAMPVGRRPEEAGRSVASVLEALERAERSVELVVVDGSHDPSRAAETRTMLASLPAGRTLVRFAAETEKRAYAAALARHSGVDERTVAFALFGVDGARFWAGAVRNAIQLDLVGERFVTSDDDTRFRLAPSPTRVDGLAVSSRNDPTELWFFGGDDEAARFVPAQQSALDVHEEVLGRSAAGLAGAGGAGMDDASPSFARRLRETPMVVRVSACGLAGDSGMRSTAYYLSRDGRTRERLLASYAQNRTTRSIFRAPDRTVITDAPFLMLPCAGIDARTLLPPHLPSHRNSDGLFGLTVTTCCPGALIAHLPFAAPHLPEPRRQVPDRMFDLFEQARVSDLLAMATRAAALGPSGGLQDRLSALGLQIVDLASRSREELLERFFLLRCRHLAGVARSLSQLLERHDREPASWAEDVERILRLVETAAPDIERVIPRDIASADPFGDFVETLRRYGRMLAAWPTLEQTARHLRAAGVRLTRPV